jgi:hypothetical protein
MDAVGEPDVRAQPAQRVDVLDGRAAEPLAAERLLVVGLRQVGVQPDALVPGQLGGLVEQVGGDRERRAGGDADAQHRVRRRVVVPVDRGGRGVEDRVDLLHHVVRGQPAPAPAEVHRAAGGQEPEPDGPRRLDLGGEQVAAVGGEDVVVVHRRGAAGPRQLRERAGRPDARGVLVEAGPHRVERGQPLEERVVGGLSPGQPLVEVVVGVHQPGSGQAAAAVDVGRVLEAVAGRRAVADRGDTYAVDHDVPGGVLRPAAVHGDHRAAVDHGATHRILRAARWTASMIFS